MLIKMGKGGFTIIELMIVIAIIGVLAAALFPAMSGYLSRARDTKKIAEISQLNTAILIYFTDNNSYLVPNTGMNNEGHGWANYTGIYNAVTYTKSLFTALQEGGYISVPNLKQNTISDIATNPVPSTTTPCRNSIPAVPISGDLYMYYFNDMTGQYSLSAYLENATQAHIDNISVSYNGLSGISGGLAGTCTRYGRNYAMGQN